MSLGYKANGLSTPEDGHAVSVWHIVKHYQVSLKLEAPCIYTFHQWSYVQAGTNVL